MKILMVTTESAPFVKTGGLGEVVYSLSAGLKKKTADVTIVLPLYSEIKTLVKKQSVPLFEYQVPLSWRMQYAGVYRLEQDEMTFYFIDNEYYFGRGGIYGYFDDGERFAFYSLAIKELILRLNMPFDIIHVHDYPCGMLLPLIREDRDADYLFSNTKLVMTIHNPSFQGRYPPQVLSDLYNLSEALSHKFYINGTISTLIAGIEYADLITTVSPNHREELLSVAGSFGLSSILNRKQDCFVGILNGIDYQRFSPLHDEYLPFNYHLKNMDLKKQELKKRLLERFNLAPLDRPVFAMVSRLSQQKGLDFAFASIDALLDNGFYVIMMGSGQKEYEEYAEYLRNKHYDHCGIYLGYHDELAHLIYAGSDFFLMPSLFEPCGIGQMIAAHYGTLPIVRETGGLKDSIIKYDGTNADRATGYSFFEPSAAAFFNTCSYALTTYYGDYETHLKLMKNAFKYDFSSVTTATLYYRQYLKLLK
ncbi:MAG: glycogen synthase [Erysipelotrichaceae bacterium]|jgi:starch synthase|nr:glycogen synthase [Erysipelotrichaceae bacterium]